MQRHLIATVGSGLLELIRVHLLHLNPLGLLIGEPMGLVTTGLDWQMVIVLSVMLSRASVIALRICLTCMSAFLLNEDSLERCTGAPVGHHDLLGIVEHLGVVYATGSRVLLLRCRKLVLLLGHLLVCHVALALVGNAGRAFAFVMDPSSLDRWSHRTPLLRLSLH